MSCRGTGPIVHPTPCAVNAMAFVVFPYQHILASQRHNTKINVDVSSEVTQVQCNSVHQGGP